MSKKRVVVPLILMAVVVLGALVWVSVRTYSKASIPNGGGKKRERIDASVITLRPTAFEPKEVTRPQGLFLLVVDNRSNVPDILLRLDRDTGEREHEEHVKAGRIDWRKPFDLHPGRYLLSEATHPNWVCRITITER